MSATSLSREIGKLRDDLGLASVAEAECDDPHACAIIDAGRPVPPDAPRCPRCGGIHVLEITVEVVEARDAGEPVPDVEVA